MAEEQTVQFGPYRLDPANVRLWRETQPVRLTPKAFQVLCYLAARPGQLVSKDELCETVWAETVVSEATLASTIQEIRKALQDNAREPRYVETVPKRGFRFIGAVVRSQEEEKQKAKVTYSSPVPSTQHPASILVGREADLTQLHHWLDKALRGERQLVFVMGEPGIGKTTMVDAFLEHSLVESRFWVRRG